MIHRSLVTDSATAPPVTTWCPTARAASRAGPTVGGYAAWPWRSVWVKSGYSGEPDFTDGWRVDLRLEHNLAMNPGQVYPRCTGGRRAGPPEGYGGVLAFLEQTQPLHVLAATIRAAEILGMLLEAEDLTPFREHRDELAALLPLLGVDRFDRRTVNRALAVLDATGTRAA